MLQRRRWNELLTSCASPVGLLGVAVLAGGVFLAASVRADPDLWGHLAFGRDIVDRGDVLRQDSYSFTSDREWVNHEWLAEVVLYAAWSTWKAPGLMVLKAFLVALTVGLLWHRSRRLDSDARLAVLALAIWSAANRLLTARPQLFSFLCFGLLLAMLHWQRRRPVVVLPAIAALFAAWANLHGGWIVGLGVTGVWAATVAILRREERWHAAAALAIPAAALLGSLATPYGIEKWRFLVETVAPHRPSIADWLPAWTTPGLFVTWLAPAAVAAWSLTRLPRPAWPWAAVSISLGVLALRVSRLDMFFGLATAWMLCARFEEASRTIPRRAAAAPGRTARTIMCVATVLAGAFAFALVGGALRSNGRCLPVTSSAAGFPEAEATQFLQNRPAGERVFTFFDHGQYAIWHLAPRHTVSMDGRRETVYSDRMVARHMAFYDNPARHARLPEELGATIVWLPRRLDANAALEGRGWVSIFDGPATTIWAREGGTPRTVVSGTSGQRCFPGP